MVGVVNCDTQPRTLDSHYEWREVKLVVEPVQSTDRHPVTPLEPTRKWKVGDRVQCALKVCKQEHYGTVVALSPNPSDKMIKLQWDTIEGVTGSPFWVSEDDDQTFRPIPPPPPPKPWAALGTPPW